MSSSALASVRRPFRAMAVAVVPEAESLDAAGWARLEAIVDDALSRRPAAVRRQLRLFVRIAEWGAVPFHGRRCSALPPADRSAWLERLQRSPLLLIRRGFWGVRTLVYMGYYGQEDVRRAIGYRAHPDGWAARRGGAVGGGGEADRETLP